MCAAGLVAERCFGFKGAVVTSEADIERDHANARALGNSLLVCLLVPWSLCLLSYTGITLPTLVLVSNCVCATIYFPQLGLC